MDEYRPGEEDEDDEETLEAEERLGPIMDPEEERNLLGKESKMAIKDLLPPGYVPGQPDSEEEDEDSEDDEDEDEEEEEGVQGKVGKGEEGPSRKRARVADREGSEEDAPPRGAGDFDEEELGDEEDDGLPSDEGEYDSEGDSDISDLVDDDEDEDEDDFDSDE